MPALISHHPFVSTLSYKFTDLNNPSLALPEKVASNFGAIQPYEFERDASSD